MSKIIRTSKPSVLPWYAAALVFVVLCAVLPVYQLWALLVSLGGACAAFGAAKKICPPRVVEHEVPFHTGVDDVDAMLTGMQKQLDTLHALNEALPDPNLSAAMTRMEGQRSNTCRARMRQHSLRESASGRGRPKVRIRSYSLAKSTSACSLRGRRASSACTPYFQRFSR